MPKEVELAKVDDSTQNESQNEEEVVFVPAAKQGKFGCYIELFFGAQFAA